MQVYSWNNLHRQGRPTIASMSMMRLQRPDCGIVEVRLQRLELLGFNRTLDASSFSPLQSDL